MKTMKFLTLASAAFVGAMTVVPAYSAEQGANFTSHHLVEEEEYKRYAKTLPAEEKLELREYLDYEYGREQCQFYRPIPEGFVRDGCDIKRIEPQRVVQRMEVQQYQPAPEPMQVSNVITDYEVHFAFDSDDLKNPQNQVLDQVANEIARYNPREVTVAGHADKAGPSDYNVKLSERRADAVSEALTQRGVTNRVIEREAYGESRPAVPTQDGVALQENRRVVVEFRK